MRGNLIICLLLATTVIAKPRPKRSLGYIKNLVSTKLFGGNSVVVVRPTLAKNETYQLFKIPGYDDMLIKVTRKQNIEPNEAEDKDKEKPQDPVIVKPEISIIGSYLGTTTEKETLLAIEIVKGLLNSGILTGGRDTWIRQLLVPQPHSGYIEEPSVVLPTRVFEEERGHIYIPVGGVGQVNHNLRPEYPVFIAPEAHPEPVHSIYSYEQKSPDADTTYESYNGKDVIVTRTEKEPPLPQYIKLRIAEVANIGAQPYQVASPLRVNPYGYSNPGMIVTNNIQQVIRCKEKSAGKVCPHDKAGIKVNQDQHNTSYYKPSQEPVRKQQNHAITNNKGGTNANVAAVNEFLKNQSVNGQLISQYVYKQMNHHSHANYTEVKVGDNIQITKDTNDNLPKNFVYVPPITTDSPLFSVLSLNHNDNHEKNEKDALASNLKVNGNKRKQFVPSAPQLMSNVNPKVNDLIQNPIVVSEQFPMENRENISNIDADGKLRVNEDVYENRGDIPGSSY